MECFARLGNALALATVREGEIVLDLGCGAGPDRILAEPSSARVIGVDF